MMQSIGAAAASQNQIIKKYWQGSSTNISYIIVTAHHGSMDSVFLTGFQLLAQY
jgi:hypothetical protein